MCGYENLTAGFIIFLSHMSGPKTYYCATCAEHVSPKYNCPLVKHRNSEDCAAARNSRMAVSPMSLPSGDIPNKFVVDWPKGYNSIQDKCARAQQLSVDHPGSVTFLEAARYSRYMQVIVQGHHLDFSLSECIREVGGPLFEGKRVIMSRTGCFAEVCLHSVNIFYK